MHRKGRINRRSTIFYGIGKINSQFFKPAYRTNKIGDSPDNREFREGFSNKKLLMLSGQTQLSEHDFRRK